MRATSQLMRRQVEERLRAAIIGGQYAPGEHLSDRVLCEQLGASRSIMREAVRLLEAEGLLTVIPHRGPFVAFLSAAEAAQIYEVRATLESLAAEGFAERASDEERLELRRVYEQLAACKPDFGQHALLQLKQRFYAVLLRGCRNAYVGRMLEQLFNRITQLRATSLSAPDRLHASIAEIGRIVESIEQRDSEGAAKACHDHVRAAAAAALPLLRERERQAAKINSERKTPIVSKGGPKKRPKMRI